MTPEQEMQEQVELEGQTPGSPRFQLRLMALKVEECQQRRGAPSCNQCPHNMFCELVQQYRRLQLTVPKGPTQGTK